MNKLKLIITISVGLIGCIILINGLFNKNNVIEQEITSENTTSNVTTTTNKKMVKTTKKKVTKKVNTKVKNSSKQEYHSYAKSYGNYDDIQMECLINLWNHESGWNPNDVNRSSGACGIPQAYPCKKIKQSEGSNDWKAQIRWGIKYISYRYKTPCMAWQHFKNKHWY